MKGLSITAISLRSFAECWEIYQTLEPALQLDYLELAIGSQCDFDYDYGDLPLVLHDSCLYEGFLRRKLHPLKPRTWQAYADFAASHNVLAVSLHPPLKRHCTQLELYDAIAQMQQTLQVPVYLEVMPDQEY